MLAIKLQFPQCTARLAAMFKRFCRDEDGISMLEFGLSLPLMVSLGVLGIEVTGMATAHMQVSQMALAVADNASRLGQTDNSAVTPTVAESDIDAVMFGAMKQGEALDFEANGRVILSSLERDTGSGKQYIHWQRCAGDLDKDSAYGNDSDKNGLTGTALTGMGPAGRQVTAKAGQAVMFVEVYYTYQPMFAASVIGPVEFKQEAALLVRDDRKLDGGGGDGLSGTASSTC